MSQPQPPYTPSENPNLIPPSGLNWRLIATVIAALAIIGLIVAIPLYQNWQTEKAAHIERGRFQGAVYEIMIDGQPTQLELGWAGPHLAVVTAPTLPPDSVVTIGGDFGKETLAWDAEYQLFGPTEAEIDPYTHHKVRVTLAQPDGEVLWSGKRWAWGVPTGHHHH